MKYETTETYAVKQKDGSVRYYVRATKEARAEIEKRYREAGKRKEVFELGNGKQGVVWR